MLTQTDLCKIQKLFQEGIGSAIHAELQVQLEPAIKVQLDKQLGPAIKTELDNQLGHAIKTELDIQLRPAIREEIKPAIKEELRKALRFYPTRVEMNKRFDGVTRKLNKIIGFFDRAPITFKTSR